MFTMLEPDLAKYKLGRGEVLPNTGSLRKCCGDLQNLERLNWIGELVKLKYCRGPRSVFATGPFQML